MDKNKVLAVTAAITVTGALIGVGIANLWFDGTDGNVMLAATMLLGFAGALTGVMGSRWIIRRIEQF